MSGKLQNLRQLWAVLLLTILAAGCGGIDAETVGNVLDYQIRKTFPPLLVWQEGSVPVAGSLRGAVSNAAGRPLAGALVLVSTARGETSTTRTDRAGRYLLSDLPPGRTKPMAAAWGYDAFNSSPLRVRSGEQQTADFVLPAHSAEPLTLRDLRIGTPEVASSDFPASMIATRIPFSFTLDDVLIDVGQIYLPAEAPADPPPTLFIVYPSKPLNWDAASVGLTRDGSTVIAVGPDGDRGLDMDGHGRDLRAAVQLWAEGRLPAPPPDDNWALLSGSFGSLIVFPVLEDLAVQPARLVDIGGVSDAFLGVQSLYSADLEIPPPYDSAVAALGRPDRDPAFFYQFSPSLFAEHLPPMLVVHMLNDPVIPHNQALALIDALEAAGVPHETLLYEDTTHYLDAYHPTLATGTVFERVLDYATQTGGS